MNKFKMTINMDGSDWNICFTGQDRKGNKYGVTTNNVHASELSKYTRGAKEDALLISRLLNWYYPNEKESERCLEKSTTPDQSRELAVPEERTAIGKLTVAFEAMFKEALKSAWVVCPQLQQEKTL